MLKFISVCGNMDFLRYNRVFSIVRKAKGKGMPVHFTSCKDIEKSRFREELDASSNESMFMGGTFLHIIVDPSSDLIPVVDMLSERVDEGVYLIHHTSVLRGNSRWRKFLKSKEASFFEFNKPERKEEGAYAVTYLESYLSKEGISSPRNIVKAVCDHSNNEIEHIHSVAMLIVEHCRAKGTYTLSVSDIQQIFFQPYDKKIQPLLKSIESRNVKLMDKALTTMFNHPKEDPSWKICIYLQKMICNWISMYLTDESGLSLENQWKPWEVKKYTNLKSRWSKESMLNFLDEVNHAHRNILEVGNYNKINLRVRLLSAFMYTGDSK